MLPLPPDHTAAPALEAGGPFLVGQDASGRWIAIDTAHRGGGLFKSRADAIRFAEFESGHRPGCIHMSPVPLRMEF